MKHKRIAILAAPVAALALALAGCGIAPEQAAAPSSSSTYTPDESLVDEPAPEASPDVTPEGSYPDSETPDTSADDMVIDFGQTFSWEDGTTATVSTPTAYTPDEWAAGGEGYAHHITMTVTVTNGSDVPLDASFTSPLVVSGDREGDEIFDDTVGGGPSSSILPGRTVTFDVAYGVDDPADVIAEFAPTWDHDAAYFTTDGGEEA